LLILSAKLFIGISCKGEQMNGCGVWDTAGATGVNVAGGDGVTVAVFTGAAVVAITAPVVSTVVGDKETGRQADRENRQTMVRRRYRTFLISMRLILTSYSEKLDPNFLLLETLLFVIVF
jgi:hypothetical protein